MMPAMCANGGGGGCAPPQPPRFFKSSKPASKHTHMLENHDATALCVQMGGGGGGGCASPNPPAFLSMLENRDASTVCRASFEAYVCV